MSAAAVLDPGAWIEASPVWPEIVRANVLPVLQSHDATVVGSWPIAVALPGADVDVICHAPDLPAFKNHCRKAFDERPNYREEHYETDPPAHICRFSSGTLRFEVFGQGLPVTEQNAYRHMLIEARLLALSQAGFQNAVLDLKRQGLSTEAAFAQLLALPGSPYLALLALEAWSDEMLIDILNIHSF